MSFAALLCGDGYTEVLPLPFVDPSESEHDLSAWFELGGRQIDKPAADAYVGRFRVLHRTRFIEAPTDRRRRAGDDPQVFARPDSRTLVGKGPDLKLATRFVFHITFVNRLDALKADALFPAAHEH